VLSGSSPDADDDVVDKGGLPFGRQSPSAKPGAAPTAPLRSKASPSCGQGGGKLWTKVRKASLVLMQDGQLLEAEAKKRGAEGESKAEHADSFDFDMFMETGYMLKVVVWNATNVCAESQVADPYVRLHILEDGRPESDQLSWTIRNNRSPVFNQPFILYGSKINNSSLVLAVYDSDRLSDDFLLAYINVPLNTLLEAVDEDVSPVLVPGQQSELHTVNYELRTSKAAEKRRARANMFGKSESAFNTTLHVSLCLLDKHKKAAPKPKLQKLPTSFKERARVHSEASKVKQKAELSPNGAASAGRRERPSATQRT